MRDSTRLRLMGRCAIRHGYAAAFPTFEQAYYSGRGTVYGVVLFTGPKVQWRSIDRDAELGGAELDDVQATWRAVTRYAGRNGFATGFPTFEQGLQNSTVVYGAWLLSLGSYI